jgi:UDP-N-acetylglucosamine 1-carboxyvinyltransferase
MMISTSDATSWCGNRETLVITGGRRLCGRVSVSGSKHSALLLLHTGLAAAAPCTIRNVPRIRDVATFLDISRYLGVRIVWNGENDLTLDGSSMVNRPVPHGLTGRFHSSYLLLPVLAFKFGGACIGLPGGCRIDSQRFPSDLRGIFEPFGYDFRLDCREQCMVVERKRPHRQFRQFDFADVGARDITVFTKVAMILGAVHDGKTIIQCPFKGPEVNDLAEMLRRMGALIYGSGREIMSIEGCNHPAGVIRTVPPDHIEAVTLLSCGVMTHGDVTVENVPLTAVGAELAALSSLGAELISLDGYMVRSRRAPSFHLDRHISLTTGPYPALSTDTHPIFAACLTQSHGTGTIKETVWRDRFSYAPHIRDMGADIHVADDSVIIRGPTELHGGEVDGHDIRSCAALLLCGLAARGKTVLRDCRHLYRGYEGLVEKLRALGAIIDVA